MNLPLLASIEIEQTIDADLPAFEGHFPGAPVLPGAMLLAMVLRAVARQPEWTRRAGPNPCVPQVKFLAAVGPGQVLHIRFDDSARAIAFSVRCGDTVVARGQIQATP
jgi:3-hydroxymyristoyl/3-hydroxydecanoyl-(acyl carrier protein) dehydratase